MLKRNQEKFYLRIAKTTARQSTCPRAKVGAVLVYDNRVISRGYNGAPRGCPTCKEEGCWTYPRGLRRSSCYKAVHAELNALLNAAYGGAAIKGAEMICTHSPCLDCLKAMLNAGVKTVYYGECYNDKLASQLYAKVYDKISVYLIA